MNTVLIWPVNSASDFIEDRSIDVKIMSLLIELQEWYHFKNRLIDSSNWIPPLYGRC